jgi:DNA-binding transcriptional ArsR family regulator
MSASRHPEPAVHLFRLSDGDAGLPVLQATDCLVALRALSEDTRLRIVGLLLDESLEVGEISKRLGASPYNISKHLRILREAGLLEVAKAGRRRLYELPAAIRRRAAADRILDLGCCRFRFDASAVPARGRMAAASKRNHRTRK